MSLNHSQEMQTKLIARVPAITGRELPEWFQAIDNGPSFLRCEERAHWLAEEHGLTHGYAAAIVLEHERHRRTRMGFI